MNTANFRRRFFGVLPAPSNLAWGLGGIAICAVVTVSAQQYQAAQQEAKPCAISDAIQQAINSKIALIGVTGTDPAKYFAVGSATSCLDGLLNTSFDLSKLIPDPLGWISDAAQFAIKKATEAAVGKVCQAARSAMGDVIGKYNNAVGSVTGWKTTIDNTIAGQSVASYGTSYSQTVTVNDVLANIPGNTMPTTATQGGQAPAATQAPQAQQPAPAVSAPNSGGQQLTVQSAPGKVTYQTPLQNQVAQPAAPATVGTSVFSR